MAKEFTPDDDALLSELGVEVETRKAVSRTPREERIIAGFEEIQRFFEEHKRAPQHGEDRDIFERLYAVRLDRISAQQDCRELVKPDDHQGLLAGLLRMPVTSVEEIDDDALLAELGVEIAVPAISELKHVRSSAEKKAAEEIANRERCEDFAIFKPLFEQVKQELDQAIRVSHVIRKDAGFLKTDIKHGEFFILGGQTLYIADVGEPIKAPNGSMDARLRVIYSNGTESNILLRSLQRAIYKDETSRRISEPSAGPLFADQSEEGDCASGTIYVLRSKSDHPLISQNREVVHKIGVTSSSVKSRISNAKFDPTFLMADVEIVATYELFNINRGKLEKLIHRFFEAARLEIDIEDRFGKFVRPREWFLVPLSAIADMVKLLQGGTLTQYTYDPETASILETTT